MALDTNAIAMDPKDELRATNGDGEEGAQKVAGHSDSEPGLVDAMIRASDALRDHLQEQ